MLQAAVTAVRNARSEYNVELSRKVSACIAVRDPELRRALEAELPSICLLAKLDPANARVRYCFTCHVHHCLQFSFYVLRRVP